MGSKKNEILKEFKPGLELAGLSIGSSILGGALQPHIPAGMINPLTETGRVTGTFVRPVVALGAMGFTLKKLKSLEKKVKRK